MSPQSTTSQDDPRTVPTLARSLYRELRSNGLGEKEILSLTGELLSLLTEDVRHRAPAAG